MIGTRLAVISRQLQAAIDGEVDEIGVVLPKRLRSSGVAYEPARGTSLHKLLKAARWQARNLARMSAQLDRARERIRGGRPLGGLFRPGSAAVDAPAVRRREDRRARNEEAAGIVRGTGR